VSEIEKATKKTYSQEMGVSDDEWGRKVEDWGWEQ